MSAWCVVDDGPLGAALAARLARAGASVTLVGTSRSRKGRPKAVRHSADLGAALAENEPIVLASPAASLEGKLHEMAPHLEGHHRLVTTAWGLTPDTHRLASEAVAALTCVRQRAVLAGAMDAEALRRGEPLALVIGSAVPSWAREIQEALTGPDLRVYTNSDPIGVELAHALAETYAVAVGVARGLKAGAATEATALTRALAELERIVGGLGGQSGTAYGLAGLGVLTDLVLDGRGAGFTAGVALARDESIDQPTRVEAARLLAERTAAAGIATPMLDGVFAVLIGQIPPAVALKGLMIRSAGTE